MTHAMEKGRIFRGELGIKSIGRNLEAKLGMDVDISMVRAGGLFDNNMFMQVPTGPLGYQVTPPGAIDLVGTVIGGGNATIDGTAP